MKVLLSHYDLDGLGCIILAKYFEINYDGIDIIDYETFNDNPDRFYHYDEIHFTDISPPEDLYIDLINKGKIIYIFDHHEKGLIYKNKENCFIDLDYCGTYIYFRWLYNKKRAPSVLSRFVNLVDVYDKWREKHKDWKEAQNLNRVLRSKTDYRKEGIAKYKDFINIQLRRLKISKRHYHFSNFELGNIENQIYKEKIALEKARNLLKIRTDGRNYKFGIFKANSKISQSCSSLLDENPDLKYIICINTYKGMNGRVSIRSKGSFDCNWLLGFEGGHKNACGATFEKDFVAALWKGGELGYKKNLIRKVKRR